MNRGCSPSQAWTSFPLVHADIVEDDVDRGDRRGDLLVEHLEEGDELDLALALVALAPDLAASGVERREEVERTGSLVLVLKANGSAELRGPRGGRPRSGLNRGLLVEAKYYLAREEGTCVQVCDLQHRGFEHGVTRHLRAHPHLVPPGLQFVMAENPRHRVSGDAGDDAVRNKLSGDLDAIPLRERPPQLVRELAGDLHDVERDLGGKRPAVGRFAEHRRGRRAASWRIA